MTTQPEDFVPVKRKVLEQVVDAAFSTYCSQHLGKLVPALRAALEQPGVEPEVHDAKRPALTGDDCKCSESPTVTDKPWARFCGAIGRGPNAPYPGMIEAFESHYSQSFTDRDWRNEAGVWAAAWKAAKAQPAPQPAQQPPRVGPGKTAEQTLAQWEHDLENALTPEQGEDFARRERGFAAQQPAQQTEVESELRLLHGALYTAQRTTGEVQAHAISAARVFLSNLMAHQPTQTTCNCRWEGDVQVQQCTLHEAHVASIHEWAERAKSAEKKLKEVAPQPDARTTAIQACIDRLEQGGKPAEAGMLRHHFAKDLGGA